MLNPLYIAVSWVLLRWHDFFTWVGMNPASGITWALSIGFLVITVRLLLFRFFIKQVHSQRKMQEVQPKIAALREKYKNDRQTLSQEMMKLQKEEGFNPLGGCLPILMQAPVFIALFHVLRTVGGENEWALYREYHWTPEQAASAGQATVFGAPIASAFSDPRNLVAELGASALATKIVAVVLIVLMVAATYITQRQVMSRSTATLDAQQAMIQKLLLYGMPASLLVSGFFFPIGVLFYWFTNNLWSMGQQFYILRRMPHPNAKKDADVTSETPKALAPKPGQKPVRNGRKPDAIEPAADGALPAKPATGAKPAPGRKPAAGKGGATAAGATAPSNGSTPEDAAGDATDDAADGTAETPGTPPAPRAKPGPGNRPGGGNRRPQGQRSPTQTRQKKKRR